jgi:hypothetical protein
VRKIAVGLNRGRDCEGNWQMKLLIVATTLSLFLGMSTFAGMSALAGPPTTAAPRPAPGPVLGAGLPVLAIGFGVYWVVRRGRTAA